PRSPPAFVGNGCASRHAAHTIVVTGWPEALADASRPLPLPPPSLLLPFVAMGRLMTSLSGTSSSLPMPLCHRICPSRRRDGFSRQPWLPLIATHHVVGYPHLPPAMEEIERRWIVVGLARSGLAVRSLAIVGRPHPPPTTMGFLGEEDDGALKFVAPVVHCNLVHLH
ncbi:hypothetical protein ACLOJK_023561, partial [Asimina triloba]